MPVCRGAKGCGQEFEIEDEGQLTTKGKAFGYPCPHCGHIVNLKNDEVKEALDLDDNQMKELKNQLKSEAGKGGSKSRSTLDLVRVPEGIDPTLEDIDLYKYHGQAGIDFVKKLMLAEHLLSLGLDKKDVQRVVYWWDKRESYRKKPSELKTLLNKLLGNKKIAGNMIDDVVDSVFSKELEIVQRVNEERQEDKAKFRDLEVQLVRARGEAGYENEFEPELEPRGPEGPAHREVSGGESESTETGDFEKDMGREVISKVKDRMIDEMFGSGSSSGGAGGSSGPAEIREQFMAIISSGLQAVAPIVAGFTSMVESQQRLLNAQIMKEMGLEPKLAFEVPSSQERITMDKQQIINWLKSSQGY